ncbi:MAG: hypothetical protein ACLP59_26580 [Bryobacteraceae bacterium]
MARAVAQYVFAALLALLSAQAGLPSVRVVTAIEISYCAETVQEIPREARKRRAHVRLPQTAPAYVSRIRPEPAAAALFQRPPPRPSLF